MSYKANPISIRINKSRLQSDLNLNKYSVLNSWNLRYNLLCYFDNLLSSVVSLPKKNVNTKRSKELKNVSMPIINGKSTVHISTNTISVFLSYYFNKDYTTKDILNKFSDKLRKAKFFFKKIYGCQIVIIHNNIYNFLWKFYIYNSYTKEVQSTNILQASLTNYNLLQEKSFFLQLRKNYEIYLSKFNKYRSNRYYHRMINTIFTIFNQTYADSCMLSNVLAQELASLRQNHKNFMKFAYALIKHCFENLCSNKLAGISVIIKGRLIFKTRQLPRKQKKLMNFGKISLSKINIMVDSSNKEAVSRFGVINIKVDFYYKKFNFMLQERITPSLIFEKLSKNNLAGELLLYKVLEIFFLFLQKRFDILSTLKQKDFFMKKYSILIYRG
jgi:hypothetical protein